MEIRSKDDFKGQKIVFWGVCFMIKVCIERSRIDRISLYFLEFFISYLLFFRGFSLDLLSNVFKMKGVID